MVKNAENYSSYDLLCLMDFSLSSRNEADTIAYASLLISRNEYIFYSELMSGVAEYSLGNVECSRKHLNRAISLCSFQNEAHAEDEQSLRERELDSIKRLIAEKDYENAIIRLKALLADDACNTEYLNILGRIYVLKHDYARAREYFQRSQKALSEPVK